jgi:hypothetical protein
MSMSGTRIQNVLSATYLHFSMICRLRLGNLWQHKLHDGS